jgi:four helix bundle protein
MTHLYHEQLDVYQIALDFVVTADEISTRLVRGRSYLADQLRRAATSILLNVAEGAGEFSKPEKTRFYRIARRSATESAAVLDICTRLQLIENHDLKLARELLHRIVSMLTRLTQTGTQNVGHGDGDGHGHGFLEHTAFAE